MRRYNYTQRRKAALRRAQLISARKRKGKRIKTGAIIGATGVTAAVIAGSGAYYRHKRSGSTLSGPMARGITPSVNIVGVEVPVTHAGVRFSRYKKSQGFSVHYTHRNSKGDKYLMGYRHKPLPQGTIRRDVGVLRGRVTAKLFGKPLPAHSDVVTGWQPSSAQPSELHQDIIDSYPNRSGGWSRDPRRRWVAGALTAEGRGRRGSLRIASETQRQAEKKPIPQTEVMARVRDYDKQMRAKGIIPNQAHLFRVAREIRKQGF